MEDVGPTASIILFFVLLLADVFFYGFGAAITAVNGKDIERKAAEGRDKKYLRMLKIIEDPTQYVHTVQLVINLVNMVMGAFYLSIWTKHIQGGILFLFEKFSGSLGKADAATAGTVSLIVTLFVLLYVILTFGVQLPKKAAGRIPEKWAYACITPVYYITVLLSPLTGLVTVSVRLILRLFGIKHDRDTEDVTEEEIISMVNEGHEQGVIQASEAEMITNIFEYGDKEAQDIMTHRKNIVALDGDMCLKDAIGFMLAEHNSRYPVYEENIDHIIGIIHLKDAMRLHSHDAYLDKPVKNIEGLLREVRFIPRTRNIDELFKQMQSEKQQMVIVVDEYGQTDGLIAMEDILEEIVGNIMDEYDEDKEYIEEKSKDEYVIAGNTPLEEAEEFLDISFEEEEFETLNGFLISRLEHIPEEGEEFETEYAGYSFRVLKVENKMIKSVLVTRLMEETQQEAVLEETEK